MTVATLVGIPRGYSDWRKVLPLRHVIYLTERWRKIGHRIVIECAAIHKGNDEYYVLFRTPDSAIESRAAIFPVNMANWDPIRHG